MLLPVILSGGGGTRLWPVSREAYPKPFMRLADGASLLQKTIQRAARLGAREAITVTNRELYFATRDEYEKAGVDIKHHYLLEPCPRNTAAAVAIGALCARERYGPDTVMLVLPADHVIENTGALARAVEQSVPLAQQGYLVTYGVRPTRAETGFGYIERGEPLGPAFHASCFVEKPSPSIAQRLVASGMHYWNSGMFCFTAHSILESFRTHAPDIHRAAEDCWRASRRASDQTELDSKLFDNIPASSIDYAVLEKSPQVAVVPGEFDWSDIGSWSAVSELTPADAAGNRVIGGAVMVESRDCYVQAAKRVVAAVGVNDLIIVDTDDALLIARRDQTQKVREAVETLKRCGDPSYRLHRTVHRPWGAYTVLDQGPGFKIKRIVVRPKAALSLQLHHHRSEHWVVVSGTAEVVNGDRRSTIKANESTFIPVGSKHRLSNPGDEDVVIIEVQSGAYVEEDDIVRFEDDYGRR